MDLSQYPLQAIAEKVGTPFYFYDGAILNQKFAELAALTEGDRLQCRFAVKANPARKVLEAARAHGMWIDAVSGNEVLRAKRAGFAMGARRPVLGEEFAEGDAEYLAQPLDGRQGRQADAPLEAGDGDRVHFQCQ